MMKKTILAIAMTGMIAAAGAAAIVVSAGFGTMEAKAQTTQTGGQVAAVEQTDPVEEDHFVVNVEIKTPYYSVLVPADWLGKISVRTVNNDTGMWLRLFRRDATGFDGHLFSILLTADEKYEIIPDYRLLGELDGADGVTYHVVSVFPTDVQFSREDQENYRAMFSLKDDILGRFEAAEGCVYRKVE